MIKIHISHKKFIRSNKRNERAPNVWLFDLLSTSLAISPLFLNCYRVALLYCYRSGCINKLQNFIMNRFHFIPDCDNRTMYLNLMWAVNKQSRWTVNFCNETAKTIRCMACLNVNKCCKCSISLSVTVSAQNDFDKSHFVVISAYSPFCIDES